MEWNGMERRRRKERKGKEREGGKEISKIDVIFVIYNR